MTSSDTAVGIKMFSRVRRLTELLQSIHPKIERVYVADDGPSSDEKTKIYNRSYPFDLQVLDLPYDHGAGASRRAIVEQMTEEFLFLFDSDHRMPKNAFVLIEQLKQDPSLGGISGAGVEPDINRYKITGGDLKEEEGKLIQSPVMKDKEIEMIAGYPLIRFDFISHAAAFRRECLEDYAWDEYYTITREHIDLFLGHWKLTDWDFGVCPSVTYEHYPGGDNFYMDNRKSEKKKKESQEYFQKKWGYNQYESAGWHWARGGAVSADRSLPMRAAKKYSENGLSGVVKSGFRHLFR